MPNQEPVYVDQSVENLVAHLIRGPVDMTQFSVFDTVDATTSTFSITANIIGASHVISIKTNDVELHEIVACTPVKSEGEQVLQKHLRDTREVHGHHQTDAYLYSSKVTIEPLDDTQKVIINAISATVNTWRLTSPEKQSQVSMIGAIRTFPSESDEAPLTLLWIIWEEESPSIIIRTVHSYPNEGKVAFTKTVITLKTRKS